MSSQKLCEGSGGTYANGICAPSTESMAAMEQCEANGGTYFAGEDTCERHPFTDGPAGAGNPGDSVIERPSGAIEAGLGYPRHTSACADMVGFVVQCI